MKAANVAIAAAGIIDFRIFLSLIEFRLYLLQVLSAAPGCIASISFLHSVGYQKFML
jgi:hypothetical protein